MIGRCASSPHQMVHRCARTSQRMLCSTRILRRGQNLVEKIVQRHAVDLEAGQVVRMGDFVAVRPAHVMTHDNTAAVMAKYVLIMGGERILGVWPICHK